MSLDNSRLAAALEPAIKSAFTSNGAADNAVTTALCTALASAIATVVIAEFTGHAVVLPLLLVAPPAGGPVTGTGSIT